MSEIPSEGATMEAPPTIDGAAASSLLAKWLIPSMAVLFGVVGYVVQAGQESLLGVETAEHQGASYLNAAADFTRDAVIRLLSWPATWPDHLLLHRPLLMVFSAVVVIASVSLTLSTRVQARFGRRRVVAVAAMMITLVVGVKFITMDAPLLKIQNLVTSSDNACWALVAHADPTKIANTDLAATECPEKTAAKGVDAIVWSEASAIAGEIVCSRVPPGTSALLPEAIAGSRACRERTQAQNQSALDDEFLGNLVLEMLTIGGALVVLRRASHNFGATAACLMILFYGVTAPYAYGKVGMTQLFEYGDARIGKDLHDSYVLEDPAIVTDKGWLKGVILRRDDKGAALLTLRGEDCPASLDNTVKPTRQRVSASDITNGQLMSFDEIRKIDLITWVASHQRNCPSI